MAKNANNQLTNIDILQLVVGRPFKEASSLLAARGLICKAEAASEHAMPSSEELVIGCNLSGKDVTLYLGKFLINLN